MKHAFARIGILIVFAATASEAQDSLRVGGEEVVLRQGFLESLLQRTLPAADVDAEGDVPALGFEAGGPFPVAAVMAFEQPLTPAARQQLQQQGIIVEEYLGGSNYIVSLAPSGDLGTDPISSTTRGALLPPAAKVDQEALEQARSIGPPDGAEADPAETRGTGAAGLTVNFVTGVSEAQARNAIAERGYTVREQLSDSRYVVEAGEDDAKALAEIPAVKKIEPPPLPELPLDDGMRQAADVDRVQRLEVNSKIPTYRGVTGRSIRIAIADGSSGGGGVDEAHDDFRTILATGAAGATRVYHTRPGGSRHPTHVAGIAGGTGLNSHGAGTLPFRYRGVAPDAVIGDYAAMGESVAAFREALVADASSVSNHSYVETTTGYNGRSRTLDELVRGEASIDGQLVPALPQVWAAGNNGVGAQYGNTEGYYGVFSEAKNTISVGSVDTRDMRLSRFSSLGPTRDGRIKPDLVAPGCTDSLTDPTSPKGITAAGSGSQDYVEMCGTSMAAPVVTGIVALMMEAHHTAQPLRPALRPATYKAILIETAHDLVKTAPYREREFENPDVGGPIVYHRGPDFATGHGLVDAAAAVVAISDADRYREGVVDAVGSVQRHCVDILAGSEALRVVLAWDDEPGTTATSITDPKLVNDLDLVVASPAGDVLPWTLQPLPQTASPALGLPDPIALSSIVPAVRGADRRNNVEAVDVFEPQAGEYAIEVTAYGLPTGNPQPYAIASSHPIKAACDEMDVAGNRTSAASEGAQSLDAATDAAPKEVQAK